MIIDLLSIKLSVIIIKHI